MINLDQKAEILIKYFRENMSQRAIARKIKLSRTTIRKYIDDYESKCEEIGKLTSDNGVTNNNTLNLVTEMVLAPKYEGLIKISLYYGFKYRFCNVAKSNEKAI
ncbi:MAG: helix-turn-helix domain-containing protein [Clostridiales bacterium]|nr:helix-turn-helix domain-containing protein [Clostridiales bacterium]